MSHNSHDWDEIESTGVDIRQFLSRDPLNIVSFFILFLSVIGEVWSLLCLPVIRIAFS